MSKKVTFKMRKLLSFIVVIAMAFSIMSSLALAAETAPESLVRGLDSAMVSFAATGSDTAKLLALEGDTETHTITFSITPAAISVDATIRVQGSNGEEYNAEQGGRIFKLADGEYMYTVRAEGYITEMGTITIDGDATKNVTLEVTPPSSLRLSRLGQDHDNGANTGGTGGTKRDMEVEGSGYVGWIRPTAWIKYASVNLLGGIESYSVNYAIYGTGAANLGFDLRVANSGSTFQQATSVGSLNMTQRSEGWGAPGRTATQTNISQDTAGVHDVYAVFTGGEYNFGYLDLTLKPETGGIKEYDISFKVKPYDAEVVVEDLKGVTCDPTATGGKSYRIEEGFYRYTVSKQGYETKTVILPADVSKTIQVVLLPVGANTYERYEAEDGVITGGVASSGDQYSDGNAVTNLSTSITLGSINNTFSNISNVKYTIEGTTTGIAEVIVGYESSVTDGNQDRIAVKSNDGTTKEVYLNESGKSTVFVDLRAGTNTIYVSNTLSPRVSNSGNAWINLDYIDVNKTLTSGSVEPNELDAPYIQPKNPIIKSIFTADPEAHVWPTNPNKLYLYPSHDIDPPRGCDLMDVYHVYSTENMVDWVDEGEILRADDLDWNRSEGGFMWAPDAAYKDGYYYFYWPTPTGTDWGNTWETGVVRSKYPDRGFEQIKADGFKGYIEGAGGNGMIDVCVRVDDDGQAYIYIGGSQRFFQGKLKDDMITLDGPLQQVDAAQVPSYHEGPSVFKREGLYYLIYPGGSDPSSGATGDKFNYCTSSNPLGPWTYRGSFFNPTNCDTSHGSIVQFKDKWYFFYHTQDLSGNGTIRSVGVDEVIFNEDGTIKLFSKTTDSVAQNGPDYVRPTGDIYDASAADIGGGATKSKDASAASKDDSIITDLYLPGSYAQFNNVDGGAGGRANIVIHYAAPDKLPKLKLFVNDFDYSFINLPSTGGRSFFTGEASFTVKQLKPGATNTIRLEGGNSKANLDYIEVIPFDDSTPPPGLHGITVLSGEHGTASADKPNAAIGEKVTLTANASEGYTFKEWQVTEPTGLTIASDNTFAMPNENVTIKPVFQGGVEGVPTWPEGSTLTASNVGQTGLTLTWTSAEDDIAVTEYEIYKGTEKIATVAGDVNNFEVTGLSAGTEYTFSVQAKDGAGNSSVDGPTVTVSTLSNGGETGDTQAPTWQQGSAVTASAIGVSGLTLTWTAAQDDTAVTEYEIYKGTEKIATVAGDVNNFEVTGLSAGTEYTFSVQAKDGAGNSSADGPTTTVSTLSNEGGTGDTEAPTWPDGSTVTASAIGVSGLTLTWTAAQDDTAVTGYVIYNGANQIAVVGGTVLSYNVTGLSASTRYTFIIKAKDAAGNISENDMVKIVTTASSSSGNHNNNNNNNSNTGSATPGQTQQGKVEITGGTITATPEVKGKQAVITLSESDIAKAAEKIAQDSNGGKIIPIEVKKVDGVNEYVQELPASVLTSDNTNQKLQIKTDIGTIVVPANMFTASDTAGATKATITIGAADKIGEGPSVEISIKLDDRSKEWNNADAPIIVSIPYAPSDKELADPEHIVAGFIDANGNFVTIPTGKYNASTGTVDFVTTQSGTFGISFVNKTFDDIAKYEWAKNAIEVLASKGVVAGTSETTYNPEAAVKRADFIVMLVKALGITAKTSDNFADVSPEAYYADALAIAKRLGITSGVGDNKFAPEAKISRQDMMTMIDHAMSIQKKNLTAGTDEDLTEFTDKESVSSYALQSVATLVKNGIVAGNGQSINPLGNATRAETAVMIYKIYNK